ncbi:MAG: polysaccharide deacetylase family protein [Chitinophagia bacterium]|jgi:peptidoglycan/xylan/chitin deacetylase (PgdA/CDA1 family)
MMSRFVLLSFDVEEFDMPLEYGTSITVTEQLSVGKKGLDAITPILDHPNIASTLFTTAHFATQFPQSIQAYSGKHEIASHTYYHSWFTPNHLKESKVQLEKIINAPVTGLRMPRMKAVDLQWVADAGYGYDSSIHPTWIPGKYNHLRAPRTLASISGIQQLPASVSPNLRIPLFWLSFKNFPYAVYKKLVVQTLRNDGYCCLYFHPWEFIDISGYGLPAFTYRIQGDALIERLSKLIQDLEREASFITIRDYIQMQSSKT